MVSICPAPARSTRHPSRRAKPPIGVRERRITGGFIKISTHQIIMAWWLHRAGHITRRQLRIWFAAFEMAERRRHADPVHGPERPLYRVEEIARLVGGQGSKTASADLRADVRALGKIGLVKIEDHAIDFAVSIDQIAVEDVSGFWTMLERVENKRRGVIVPRRTLRALAAGFSRAVTAVMIAMLIRSLFWHREQGDYRVDGRTKLSWVAEVFGISRRATTDAMAKLIDLGWLEPLPTDQWKLNRWGVHVRIVTDWKTPDAKSIATQQGGAGESASPRSDFGVESASPCLNRSASSFRRTIKTRKLGSEPSADPAPTGFSRKENLGSRKKKQGGANIRDIQPEHLERTEDLLELHRQASEAGLANASESGRLDFLSLAERARTRGHRPGALLTWLLREKRFEYITQADEDAAAQRLREWRNGSREQGGDVVKPRPMPKIELSDDERFVQACLRTANGTRFEPFHLAREAKGWNRERWEALHAAYQQKDRDRWA